MVRCIVPADDDLVLLVEPEIAVFLQFAIDPYFGYTENATVDKCYFSLEQLDILIFQIFEGLDPEYYCAVPVKYAVSQLIQPLDLSVFRDGVPVPTQ